MRAMNPVYRDPLLKRWSWTRWKPPPSRNARIAWEPLETIVRLKPGFAPKQAEQAMGPLLNRWAEVLPDTRKGLIPRIELLSGGRTKAWQRFLPQASALALAMALLLLLGCMNVANLQLSRWLECAEQATRQALGASPVGSDNQLGSQRLAGGLLLAQLQPP